MRFARVILTTNHRQVGAGEIRVDHGARSRVYDIDIAAKERLDSSGTRANVEQIHIGAIFLIEARFFSQPKNREGACEGRVGDAELLRA